MKIENLEHLRAILDNGGKVTLKIPTLISTYYFYKKENTYFGICMPITWKEISEQHEMSSKFTFENLPESLVWLNSINAKKIQPFITISYSELTASLVSDFLNGD